jgi:hypothetical protein
MRGLPKSIIAKYGISKKAWDVFRGRRKSLKVRTPTRNVVGVKMAKRRRFSRIHRRRGARRIPLALVGGIAGTVLGGHCNPEDTTIARLQKGDFPGAAVRVIQNFTGYNLDGQGWNWQWINWEPLVAGIIVHKAASLLGVNRAIGRTKIPLINI